MAVFQDKGNVVVNWQGMPELQAMIKELGRDFSKTEQRQAFRYALKPIKEQMRENIPQNKSGKLWFSIDIGNFPLAGIYRGVAMAVGPRKKKGVYNKQGWHAHFLEGGTRTRTFKNPRVVKFPEGNFARVTNTGKMPKYRVFSKGIDSKIGEVSKRAADKFGRILDKIMDRHPSSVK